MGFKNTDPGICIRGVFIPFNIIPHDAIQSEIILIQLLEKDYNVENYLQAIKYLNSRAVFYNSQCKILSLTFPWNGVEKTHQMIWNLSDIDLFFKVRPTILITGLIPIRPKLRRLTISRPNKQMSEQSDQPGSSGRMAEEATMEASDDRILNSDQCHIRSHIHPNSQLIYAEQNMTVHRRSDGTLDARRGPIISMCTSHNFSCPVEAHRAQGILCPHHTQTMEEHIEAIEVALTYRLTQPTPFGFTACILCPYAALRSKREVTEHIRTHGSLIGVTYATAASVNAELRKYDALPQPLGCSDCEKLTHREVELVIHRGIHHTENFQHPLICERCYLPLCSQTYDEHFQQHHSYVCCGKLLSTAGDQIKHSMLSHPNTLSRHVDPTTFDYLMTVTRDYDPEKPLPWGDECWILTPRRTRKEWKRRKNEIPLPGTEAFRAKFNSVVTLSPVTTILEPYCRSWTIHMAVLNAATPEYLENVEKMMIIELGKEMSKYLTPDYVSGKHPATTEVHVGPPGHCSTCHDWVIHTDTTKCWNIGKNSPRTSLFLAGKYDKNILDEYPAILIGNMRGYYGYTPSEVNSR